MADRKDEDGPRKSGKPMPPFVAPRTGEHPAAPAPSALGKRRSTPLFVPPAAAESDPPEAAPVPGAREQKPGAPAPPAREARGIDVENLEPEEISLTITGERPAIGDSALDVIAYEEANSELRSDTAEGKQPKLEDLELESTELNLAPSASPPAPPAGLEIESFWAAEAFAPSTAKMTPESSPAVMPEFTEPTADAPPAPPRRSTLDSLRVEEVLPPRMPTPQSTRAVAPHAGRTSAPGPAIRGMPPVEVRTPRQLEALKELEPWGMPAPATAVDASHLVAEALERVASRIRKGEVRVPADASAATDENALSAALQALVRAPRR